MKVDKYGRKVAPDKSNRLKKYYRVQDIDAVNTEDAVDVKEGKLLLKTSKTKPFINSVGGEGDMEDGDEIEDVDVDVDVDARNNDLEHQTTDLESMSETDEETLDEGLIALTTQADREDILNVNNVPTIDDQEITNRLAIVNLDWDNIKVCTHLFH